MGVCDTPLQGAPCDYFYIPVPVVTPPVWLSVPLLLVTSSLLMLREVFFTDALRFPNRHESVMPKLRTGTRIFDFWLKVSESRSLLNFRYFWNGELVRRLSVRDLSLKNDLLNVKPWKLMPVMVLCKPFCLE